MSRRYEVSDMNKQLIWNLRDIGHIIRQMSEGRGSQKRVLGILNETGPVTQSELTQRLGIQPGSASEVLGKLESAGLIRRTPSETDHRTTDVSLTEYGICEAKEVQEKMAERHQRMFSCITEDEKEILLELLEKINNSWDQEYRSGAEQKIHRMWYRRR